MSELLPPETFSEWLRVLELFAARADDAAVAAAIKAGSFAWESRLCVNLIVKIAETLNIRLNMAVDRFQLDVGRGTGGERELVNAMIRLRRELKFLAETVEIRTLPAQRREELRSLVTKKADEIQKSLEDSAQRPHDKLGRLASLIRHNRVNAI